MIVENWSCYFKNSLSITVVQHFRLKNYYHDTQVGMWPARWIHGYGPDERLKTAIRIQRAQCPVSGYGPFIKCENISFMRLDLYIQPSLPRLYFHFLPRHKFTLVCPRSPAFPFNPRRAHIARNANHPPYFTLNDWAAINLCLNFALHRLHCTVSFDLSLAINFQTTDILLIYKL